MTPLVADPLLLLVAGLVIDAMFGDMPAIFRHVPHPVVLAGRAIAFFDRKLNRQARSETSRRERGIVTVIVLVGGAALLGLGVERVCGSSFFHLVETGIYIERLYLVICFEAGRPLSKSKIHVQLPLFGRQTRSHLFG